MSTTSLPSYIAPSLNRIPSYTAEPPAYERRIAIADRLRPQTGKFMKQSKNGDAVLLLSAQEEGVQTPIYGSGGTIEGEVQVNKPESLTSVEVKIEGKLRLKEIAEGGSTSAKLCLETVVLWSKSSSSDPCPQTLRFALQLPTHFTYDGQSYPLPPTYDVKLSGLPGFTASIDYSISVLIDKPHSVPGLVPLVKSTLFGIPSNSSISTPFLYYPRTRPAVPPPPPLPISPNGFIPDTTYCMFPSTIHATSASLHDITSILYIPSSRIFCKTEPIPFHLTFEGSAMSLATFLPYGPNTKTLRTGSSAGKKRMTRIQLMRQSTVDVRNTEILGTKTDMWRVDCIGEGTFRVVGDGPNWISYSGEIVINPEVKVAGFKAAGLTVKDCIVLSMLPPEPQKAPFNDLRQLVPIRLTTDPWIADGSGVGVDIDAGVPLSPPLFGTAPGAFRNPGNAPGVTNKVNGNDSQDSVDKDLEDYDTETLANGNTNGMSNGHSQTPSGYYQAL